MTQALSKFQSFRLFAGKVGALAAPYFNSEEKWKARGLLAEARLVLRLPPVAQSTRAVIARAAVIEAMADLVAALEVWSEDGTLAAFLLSPDGACDWIHSGDSRLYHFHRGKPVFRTLDHSLVQQMVDRGEITADEALNHPNGNVLMGCLGTERDPPVDTQHLDALDVGDALLACSDGLWHYFRSEELARTIDMLSAREACEFLVQKARTRAKGTGDNLSLIIVKLEPLSTT